MKANSARHSFERLGLSMGIPGEHVGKGIGADRLFRAGKESLLAAHLSAPNKEAWRYSSPPGPGHAFDLPSEEIDRRRT